MTQLNCGPVIFEKSINPSAALCFQPNQLTAKVPATAGDETEGENSVVLKKENGFRCR